MLQKLHHGLIVSCQAPADSPLSDPNIIAAMAKAAVNQGAVGVRIESTGHILAVRQQVEVPIIGLWKRQFVDSEVYITPTFEEAIAVANAGSDIVAIDATLRPRPRGEKMADIINKIHAETGKLVMADVDSLESAIAAAEAGADLIGTTLYGYTAATKHLTPPGFDLLQAMVEKLEVPIICEGGLASIAMCQTAIQLGAYAVVVGTAITGIDLQVQAYVKGLGSSPKGN